MGMEGSNHACAPGRVSPLPLRLLPAGRLVFGLMLGYLASAETHGALAKLPTNAFCHPVRAPCEASDKNQALSSSQRSCSCSCPYPTVRRSCRGASRSSLRMSATRGGNLADEDFKGQQKDCFIHVFSRVCLPHTCIASSFSVASILVIPLFSLDVATSSRRGISATWMMID
eukprot:752019-Hanusia_phi.AAC.1